MAGEKQRRYSAYRGKRRRSSPVLKTVAAMLALLLIAFLAFALTLGGRVEYTDDGVQLALYGLHKVERAEDIEVRLIIDD